MKLFIYKKKLNLIYPLHPVEFLSMKMLCNWLSPYQILCVSLLTILCTAVCKTWEDWYPKEESQNINHWIWLKWMICRGHTDKLMENFLGKIDAVLSLFQKRSLFYHKKVGIYSTEACGKIEWIKMDTKIAETRNVLNNCFNRVNKWKTGKNCIKNYVTF